jgi:hypothetical protein
MPFRIRKRVRILPHLWINVHKGGASLSIGGRGLTLNANQQGLRETLGLPGTGISYRTRRRPIGTSHRAAGRRALRQAPRRGFWSWLLWG